MEESRDPSNPRDERDAPEAAAPSDIDPWRLAAIVEWSDDAIVSKDVKGTITSWNKAAERIFGYTAPETIGRNIRLIIPNDRQSEEDLVLSRILKGEAVEHFETLRVRKDGTLIPISLTVSPIRDATGKVIGASKIARDITAQKRAEALLERSNRQSSFLAQVSAAFTRSRDVTQTLKTLANFAVPQIADWCAIDVVNHANLEIARVAIAHVNPAKIAFAETVRSLYEDPSAPYSPSAVIRTGVPSMVSPITDEMLTAAAPGDADRVRIIRSLGLVSYLCVPMIARDRTYGALTLATSISGRRYTEEDLRFAEDIASRAALAIENARAYEQLDTANRLKDEFLATLSHELRTPLNAVLGYTRILRSGTLSSDRVAQALQVIERNASSLTQIVEDVLDVSRIIAGKTRLQVQLVDLSDVIRNAVETVAPAADAKGVHLQMILDTSHAPVSGDADRLQQVVWNLLSNAVKFTPRGGRVQVRLERINSHIEIIVSDTGIGMPPEFLPHIFERFRQAEGGTTRRHGGLGLGLAISRHIAEMHGGTIHAASEGEGKGATFRVKLPLAIVHRETHPEPERVHPRAERPSPGMVVPMPSLEGLRVLVVDDDEDALGLLREILEAAGAQVTTVYSALAALHALEENHPDAMIADLGMPTMDGFELIQRIRESPDPAIRHLPAAALTAYARSEDRAKALRSGFEMHLAKPIDPAELAAAVAALGRRRGWRK
jgi:PAS domain S-box-containing protein